MSTERGQGELVEVLEAHWFFRFSDQTWTWDCICGEPILLDDGFRGEPAAERYAAHRQHLANLLQAHVDAEVAAALEVLVAELERKSRVDLNPVASATYLNAARIVRAQIPTSGGGAV